MADSDVMSPTSPWMQIQFQAPLEGGVEDVADRGLHQSFTNPRSPDSSVFISMATRRSAHEKNRICELSVFVHEPQITQI